MAGFRRWIEILVTFGPPPFGAIQGNFFGTIDRAKKIFIFRKTGRYYKPSQTIKGGVTMIYRRLYHHPTVSLRNAFDHLETMRQQFDQLFGDDSGALHGLLGAGVFPQINLTEDADRFYIRAELPGVKTGDIELQATSKTLSIAGERKIEKEDEGVRYHRREREAGKFSRIITMPTEINADRIEARMQDGILTIRVPKAEAVKPRQIAIN
jgi:HSP20 family protein